MVVNIQGKLNQIAALLKTKVDNTKTSKIPNTGIVNKILKLSKSSQLKLNPTNDLESLELQQWIEYINTYAAHIDSPQNAKTVLSELNEMLSIKTYLVGYRLTIADILLFYVLKDTLVSLSNFEKEKYLNLCRWFDNLQHDDIFKQKHEVIDFSSNYLAVVVPSRH
ncbi:unnamed protein product [Phyllotreta striolata]|uniref:GST C-terminal domain-containing protein n=1 Tax=Phyllotreta striolata TaxID=444603 RepID=A0A9N9TKZ4_PHYSR|nr:unnamed protein product [Phyllotreta striolata]